MTQDIDEVKKRLKQAEKERIAKGFICHLCGAVMGRASKYYHLRTFHQGSVLKTENLNKSAYFDWPQLLLKFVSSVSTQFE